MSFFSYLNIWIWVFLFLIKLVFCIFILFLFFIFLSLHHFFLLPSWSPCARVPVTFAFVFSFIYNVSDSELSDSYQIFCRSFEWNFTHETDSWWLSVVKLLSAASEKESCLSCVCCVSSCIIIQVQVNLMLNSYFESLLGVVFEVSGRKHLLRFECFYRSWTCESRNYKLHLNLSFHRFSGHAGQIKCDCQRTFNLITHLLHLSADCFCSSVIIFLFTCKSCGAVRPLSADK